MKSDLVLGRVVGGLSDVILEVGAIGGQANRAGNGFGGRVLFLREEGEAAAGRFDVIGKASDERAVFFLEVDVGHSIGGFRLVLGKFGVETVIIFVEIVGGATVDVRRFSIGWNLLGIRAIVGGGGILHDLRRVGAHTVGDFTDAGDVGDGFNLFLRSGVDIR